MSDPEGGAEPFGAGITADALALAAQHSGFPLQSVVASQLHPAFRVIEEWAFLDEETQKARTLDVYAVREFGGTRLVPLLTLLIECKRSDMPFVFFPSQVRRGAPYDFPHIAGLLGGTVKVSDGKTYQDVSGSTLLGLNTHPFVTEPVLCTTFTKAQWKGDSDERRKARKAGASDPKDRLELKGDEVFRPIVLALASAHHHLWSLHIPTGRREFIRPCVMLNVCVLDAPLVVMHGNPDQPEPRREPWVRVVWQGVSRQATKLVYKHHAFDFVERAHLANYLERDVMPFATEAARRMTTCEGVLLEGEAVVPDLKAWSFKDLKAVKRKVEKK